MRNINVRVTNKTNRKKVVIPGCWKLRHYTWDADGTRHEETEPFVGTRKEAYDRAATKAFTLNHPEMLAAVITEKTVEEPVPTPNPATQIALQPELTTQSEEERAITLIEWLDHWWTDYDFQSPMTRDHYAEQIQYVRDDKGDSKCKYGKIYPAIGTRPLKDITFAECRAFITRLGVLPKKRGGVGPISTSTVTHIRSVVKNSLNWAVDAELIDSNPFFETKPPKSKPVRPPRSLKKAEYVDFINAANEDLANGLAQNTNTAYRDLQTAALVFTSLSCGCRRGELTALKWSKIDFTNHTIEIDVAICKPKNTPITEKDTKTHKTRTVHISDKSVEVLKLWKLQQDKNASMCTDYQNNDLIWCRKDGRPCVPSNVATLLNKFQKRHGFERRICMHEARHTMVTSAAAKDVNIVSIAKQAGHASIKTTMRYLHMDDIEDTNDMAKIQDEIIGSMHQVSG